MRHAEASTSGERDSKEQATETIEKVFGDDKAVAGVVETAIHIA